MPNIDSAKKRVRRTAKRTAVNHARKSRIRSITRKVEEALAKGPTRNGFPNELWTLARISTVIEKVTGVSYSTTQTWSILRERLGWSRQRPARRAAEADQDAIAAWARDRWPVVKKTPDAAGRGSSSKTSRGSLSSPR